MKNFNNELLFNDLIWVAADKRGFLAVFPLGGSGPIPERLTQSKMFDVEQIEFELDKLEYITEAIVEPNIDFTDTLEYARLARKGFFSFNYPDFFGSMRPVAGGYELIASPVVPLNRMDLSGVLLSAVEIITFGNINFADKHVVNPEHYYKCLKANWDHSSMNLK